MALFPHHIRLKRVPTEDYNQPLGVLAGIRDIPPAEGKYEGGELPDTLFVFCNFSDSRLEQVLASLRKCGTGPFPYKAVTDADKQAVGPRRDCFTEIRREHEAMHP